MSLLHTISGSIRRSAVGASILAILLAGCGGGGGGGGDSANVPEAPTGLTISYDVKRYAFTWNPVAGATHYQLFEDADGPAGSQLAVQVGGDLSGTTGEIRHATLLHERLNAQYAVRACNAAGCGDSAVIQSDGSKAIGYFKASNTDAEDRFGYAVALSMDGTTLAVGAPREKSKSNVINGDESNNDLLSGAVYIYVRTGEGVWSKQAYIKPSNPGLGDDFGASVALSADGSTLAVGAPLEDSGATRVHTAPPVDESREDSGAVYVFRRDSGSWSQQAYVKADNTGADDRFGYAIALSADGSTLAVGAFFEDGPTDNVLDQGAVYVYVSGATGWTFQSTLRASTPALDEQFGTSVALSANGNVLAVGTPYRWVLSTQAGAVLMFERENDTWQSRGAVEHAVPDAIDKFGVSVALSADGSTLAVGAQYEDGASSGVGGDQQNDEASAAGAAYVFTREGTNWIQQAYIKASNTEENDVFGYSVSLSADGSKLAIGAIGESSAATGIGGDQSDNSTLRSGAAYLYVRDGTTWQHAAYVKATNTQGAEVSIEPRFGLALALSGDGRTFVVGSPGERSGATGINGDASDRSKPNSGAVYLY